MSILGKLRALFFLFLLSASANATTFNLPLNLSQKELGMVSVSLQGMDIDAVSLSQLKNLLGQRVSDESWLALSLSESLSSDGMVSLNTLAEAGIDISFDPSTLSLTARITDKALGLANVDFGEQYEPFSPSDNSPFSWLNSFNFAHNSRWEGEEQEHDRYSSVEWLTQLNIGGASGVHFEAANYLQMSETDSQVLRGEWTAFYDNPHAPFRASVGDVESGISGFQSNVSLGGLSIESDYSELQPQRIIGPSNSQELILQESAEVEIIVNGQIIFSGRQDAGRFNLMNLPMSNGANDITVNVTYLSGKTETLVFSQFYNSNLLDEGMFNYAFSVGVPSTFSDDGIEYLDTWAATGFTEYGLFPWLTLGVNGTFAKHGQIFGGLATIRSDWGNISARLGLSNHAEADAGNVTSLSFESAIIGAPESQTPNLRLSVEFADNYASSPWDNKALPVSYERYLANYVLSINARWDATLSGSYYLDNNDDELTGITSTLNWKNGDITLGAGVTYSQDSNVASDDTQYFFTLDWRWNHKQYGYNLGASYNTRENQSRIDASKTNNDRVGSVGFRALGEYEDTRQRQNAQLSYTANRVRLEGEVERSELNNTSSDASYLASIRGNTAFGFTDGKLGWGRAQPGPFVVAQLHPTLSDHEAQLGVAQDGSYKAAATSLIGGLLPLDMPYSRNTVDLSVQNAPIGYDWGESRVIFSPAATTGHLIMIGSDASYTAKGVLLTDNGTPISYLQGELIRGDKRLSFFTNKTGRFFAQGIGPGTYTMTIGNSTYQPLTIVVEENDNRLIDLGTLTAKCVEENCDANP
ncbi:fimbria/pilus outer membrane usher protein [Enterovibrio sp. 27052020O]|uniref:fimbria/pilus outer membrane usher protein n=1 Tax=Enterovibrio sp. 27052020O TaxID=3241166 RepID=UPI00388F79AF